MRGAPPGGGLDRYREIVPDWDAFHAACQAPLPAVVRTNTARIAPEDLLLRLSGKGFHPRPLPWAPFAFEVEGPIGRTIEHWLGLYYVQEAVQLLPVLALGPRPAETVLDLCAAPGGKGTHIAVLIGPDGLLVANEPNGRRQQSLLANLNRLGILNAAVTSYPGEAFPGATRFDRVLVDAPCSAEGTLRKRNSRADGAPPRMIARLAALQRRLVVRAYDLLRPGGVLVYSTCTFAPEENEAVVSTLLAERDATVEPFPFPVPTAPGILTWEQAAFPDEVARCARVYPHHLNSGGGFIARLRKP